MEQLKRFLEITKLFQNLKSVRKCIVSQAKMLRVKQMWLSSKIENKKYIQEKL